MEVAVIGLPGAGKTTLFCAITDQDYEAAAQSLARDGFARGVVPLPDERLDKLAALFEPRPAVPAQVTFLDGGGRAEKIDREDQARRTAVDLGPRIRAADALVVVLRNFPRPGQEPDPSLEWRRIEEELILSDLVQVEAKLERLAVERQRGKKPDPEEVDLLGRAKQILEQHRPLRSEPEVARAPKLRGYTFVSARPRLMVVNNDDEDDQVPEIIGLDRTEVVRGRLEMELGQMEPDDRAEFAADFGFDQPAAGRILRGVFRAAGRISFFTIGDDEVRAWTIHQGDTALDAAGTVHTDMARGFIRAEVIAWDDLLDCGSLAEAKKRGLLRLEGKEYVVRDGDVIYVRFNV